MHHEGSKFLATTTMATVQTVQVETITQKVVPETIDLSSQPIVLVKPTLEAPGAHVVQKPQVLEQVYPTVPNASTTEKSPEPVVEKQKKPIEETKQSNLSQSHSRFGVKNIANSEQEFTYIDELSEHFRHTINDKRYADTVIRCGKNLEHKFYAHRIVLSNRSKFFKDYYGKIHQQSDMDRMGRIRYDNPELFSDMFSKVIEYLYTGSIRLRLDNVLEVLSLAENFGVASLKVLCEKYLTKNIDDDNACHLLEISREFNAKELNMIVLKYMEKGDNIKAILKSDGFKHLRRDNLVEIIRRDNLMLSPEEEILVFNAVAAWAKATKQMEKASQSDLNAVLSHVRFPLMSSHQLSEIVEPTKLVPQELLFEAFKNHLVSKTGESSEERFRPRGVSH